MTARGCDTPVELGPLELLVIQPTPFCNLDCSYCYLPERTSRKQLSLAVLERIFAEVFASGLVQHPFTILWHAGEPLVLPPAFYEGAFALAQRHNTAGVPLCHSFQTNGTLIDREWCAFLRGRDVLFGVSVDGPAFLHDSRRRTRQGRGTLERVLEGIGLLREYDIPFHVITVLTAESLDYPDELFDFYQANGIREVGFNVEEVEGPHTHSSLAGRDAPGRYARFLERFFDLAGRADPPLRVRELELALGLIVNGPGLPELHPQEVTPLAIVSVDCDGNFSTFSPELLGLRSARYGDFVLGNLTRDSLRSVDASPRFQALQADVAAGVDRCRRTCPYFAYCGGVAPVNKYFENGSFDSTETLFCRLTRQVVLDVVLGKLERNELTLPVAGAGSPV
jgi:uncharacterized protein